MAAGVVRPLDPLGRIVVPKEIRRTLKIQEGDLIDISVEGGRIVLTPCKLKCVACGNANEDTLKEINGIWLCPDCIKEFGRVEK